MEVEAQKKFQEKLTALDARLAEVNKKLTEMQGKKTEGNRLIATPEMAKAIADFQKQQATMNGERRQIRRALREDIDRLEKKLLIVNLLSTPLLVGAFGFWFYRSRKK
jgi:cytochrome c556